ncbi:MAG: histidine phosphatase family protein [Tabrizicola sp.]|nr:histidine phosphatase family protein [Tabrizicola sp.]
MTFLLRHGQTEFNLAGRYQGRVDSPLTGQGLEQAARMGETLAALVDARQTVILTSPLQRALRTAQIIGARLGLEPLAEPRLIEVSMGDWEGRTAAEIDEGWPGARASHNRNEWFFGAPGGEDYPSVAKRMGSLLSDISQRSDRVHVLVGHAISGRVLRGLHARLEPLQALRLEVSQDALFALESNATLRRIPLVPSV